MSKHRKYKKWLPVVLTEPQLLDKSRELSQRIKERSRVEAEKKSVVAEYGENLKELAGDITRLSDVVADGAEDQSVDVQDEVHIESQRIKTIRMDTNEVVIARVMTELEIEAFKQGDLF